MLSSREFIYCDSCISVIERLISSCSSVATTEELTRLGLADGNSDINAQICSTQSAWADLLARVLACSHCGRVISRVLNDADGEYVGLFSWPLSPAL